MRFSIRPEQPGDTARIRAINEQAFQGTSEADIVDRLRSACPDILSLVAEDEGGLCGHILFSPAVIEAGDRATAGLGLAPMAVLPDRQRQGIGSALVRQGLDLLRARGCPFVVVLGHPHYYPRFGFEPASRHGVRCPWEGIPDEAFMLLLLDPSLQSNIAGTARYRPEFDAAV